MEKTMTTTKDHYLLGGIVPHPIPVPEMLRHCEVIVIELPGWRGDAYLKMPWYQLDGPLLHFWVPRGIRSDAVVKLIREFLAT